MRENKGGGTEGTPHGGEGSGADVEELVPERGVTGSLNRTSETRRGKEGRGHGHWNGEKKQDWDQAGQGRRTSKTKGTSILFHSGLWTENWTFEGPKFRREGGKNARGIKKHRKEFKSAARASDQDISRTLLRSREKTR